MVIEKEKIYLKNTLGNEIQEFNPIRKGQVGIYHCGPTVYSQAHIGNISVYIFSDVLRRLFESQNYHVNQIINITDVGHLTDDQDNGEDKIEKASVIENLSAAEITKRYTNRFFDDLKKINIPTNKILFPKATDHIKDQINLIKKIEKAGLTYKTNDGIYFDTSLYKNYGQLGNIDLKNLKEGARTDINTEKKNATDFALWKFSPKNEKRQQEWQSPWGVGFPGWHIECSAMSKKYLGNHFDIHVGGIEHIPIHHNNEMAQSEIANKQKQANYWLHTNHITLDGQKMSKSLGNILYLDDLIDKEINPMSFRYWYLTSKYNTQANFTMESVKASQNALFKIVDFIKSSGISDDFLFQGSSNFPKMLAKFINLFKKNKNQVDQQYYSKIIKELNYDLNTPKAIALIWDLIKDDFIPVTNKAMTIIEIDKILGLNIKKLALEYSSDLKSQNNTNQKIPSEIIELANQRQSARENKDFKKADDLRSKINQAGYEIIDQTDKNQNNFIIQKK